MSNLVLGQFSDGDLQGLGASKVTSKVWRSFLFDH